MMGTHAYRELRMDKALTKDSGPKVDTACFPPVQISNTLDMHKGPQECSTISMSNTRLKRTSLRETEVLVLGESFTEALSKMINRYYEENKSNTPDFILAKYMRNALDSFNIAVQEREEWYGRRTF